MKPAILPRHHSPLPPGNIYSYTEKNNYHYLKSLLPIGVGKIWQHLPLRAKMGKFWELKEREGVCVGFGRGPGLRKERVREVCK